MESCTHDSRGRITSRTDALGNTTRYAYEGTWLKSITDPLGSRKICGRVENSVIENCFFFKSSCLFSAIKIIPVKNVYTTKGLILDADDFLL